MTTASEMLEIELPLPPKTPKVAWCPMMPRDAKRWITSYNDWIVPWNAYEASHYDGPMLHPKWSDATFILWTGMPLSTLSFRPKESVQIMRFGGRVQGIMRFGGGWRRYDLNTGLRQPASFDRLLWAAWTTSVGGR